MNKLFYTMMLSLLTIRLAMAGYEVEFLVENEPRTKNTSRSIFLKEINLTTGVLIQEEDEPEVKEGVAIEPYKKLKIRISDLENATFIDSKSLCSFLNGEESEKRENKVWQSIVFMVPTDTEDETEEASLYWAPSERSLFVNGGSRHFVFSAFQRSLPKKKKDGSLKYVITLNLSLTE